MNAFIRFGRRISTPSSVQVRHELRAFCAEEDVREECAAKEELPAGASWDEIYAHRAAVAARIPASTAP
jgi:hypothetical protein